MKIDPDIGALREPEDARRLNPGRFTGCCGDDLSSEELVKIFEVCGAIWLHDGDPKRPHAELTTGFCSNGFFNCGLVLRYPNLCEIMADQLFRRLLKVEQPDWVIGSPMAAITLSYAVARIFGAIHGFAEKNPEDPKKMLWKRDRIPAGAKVLQVEELVTTSHTFREVRRAIQEGNGEPVEFLPVVATLVHRPLKLPADYGDLKVVALVEREVWAAKPEECQLCQAGSKRLRPKTHWAELTGQSK